MPKSTITWYKTQANRIMHDIKELGQMDIAIEINESQQVISYRIRHLYQEQLEDMLRILKLAGYEIVKKDDMNTELLEKLIKIFKNAGYEIVERKD